MSEQLEWRMDSGGLSSGEYSAVPMFLGATTYEARVMPKETGRYSVIGQHNQLLTAIEKCQSHHDARQSEENKKLAGEKAIQAVRAFDQAWTIGASKISPEAIACRSIADEVLRLLGYKP